VQKKFTRSWEEPILLNVVGSQLSVLKMETTLGSWSLIHLSKEFTVYARKIDGNFITSGI
jgi:hypothetical protein